MNTYNFSIPGPDPNPGTTPSPTENSPSDICVPMTWQIFRSMSAAIFNGGVSGVGVGICAAAAIGVFIYIIGAIAGAIISIPFGFVAGVIGMAIGGRKGWAIGGAASLAIPLLICTFLIGTAGNVGDSAGYFLIAVIAGLYGGGVGYWYGGRANVPYVETVLPGWIAPGKPCVSLYDIPLRWRLLSLTAILLTFAGVIWDIYRLCTVGF